MRQRTGKYNAQRTEYGGRMYDSKSEAKRAYELDLLQLAGEVAWWLPQVPVMVGEPGVDKPFRVDFLVATPVVYGSVMVHAEDVKGMETASFRRHVKQWKLRGPFPLHVLTGRGTEIIERVVK